KVRTTSADTSKRRRRKGKATPGPPRSVIRAERPGSYGTWGVRRWETRRSRSRARPHDARKEDDDWPERDQEQDDRDRRAEADQAGLADAVVGDQDREQLEAVLALVDDEGDVKSAQRFDGGNDH